MKNIVFVTGIHGVGKGYFLNEIKKELNICIYEASELIRKFGYVSDENKKVADASNNQNILLESIKRNVKEDKFILDGHTVLLNLNNEYEKIPLETFKSLKIKCIILIYDEPQKIVDRLYLRDNSIYNEKTIDEFQKIEISYAQEVARILDIPLFMYKNGTENREIKGVIKEWFDE